MKPFHLVLALSIGLCSYALLDGIGGENGWQNLDTLKKYEAQLGENIKKLSDISEDLRGNIDKLRSDHEYLLVQAHRIGLVLAGEDTVKITGTSLGNENPSPGVMVLRPDSDGLSPVLSASVAIVLAIVALILMVLLPDDEQKPRRAAPRKAQGIRVHTASLE